MVEKILLPEPSKDGFPEENLSQVKKLLQDMDSDEFQVREKGTAELKELGDKIPGLYGHLKRIPKKELTPEQWYRVQHVTHLLTPTISWEQLRWKMFLAAKNARVTTQLLEITKNLFEKMSAEDKAALLGNAKKRAATLSYNKGYNPYTGVNSEQAKVLTALWDSDVAIFQRTAEIAGYEFTAEKLAYVHQLVRNVTISTGEHSLRLELRKNENVRMMSYVQFPETVITLKPGEWVSSDTKLPTGDFIDQLGEIKLYPKIRIDPDITYLFSWQQYYGASVMNSDPLTMPTHILVQKFPRMRSDIDKVHLSESARAKALKFD